MSVNGVTDLRDNISPKTSLYRLPGYRDTITKTSVCRAPGFRDNISPKTSLHRVPG